MRDRAYTLTEEAIAASTQEQFEEVWRLLGAAHRRAALAKKTPVWAYISDGAIRQEASDAD